MIKQQTAGKIYPAEMWSHHKSSALTAYAMCLYNEEKRQHENVPLLEFNNEIIAAEHIISFEAYCSQILFLLPIHGSLKYSDSHDSSYVISPETFFAQELHKGDKIEVSNIHSVGVNYIRIIMNTDVVFPLSTEINSYNTENPRNKNRLIKIFKTGHPAVIGSFKKISIGKFAERGNATYILKNKNDIKCLFYVISGEFEIGGRLLHKKDGLILWNTDSIEIESLCPDAILLVIEYGYI
ncbi:hypothetical protein A9P82_00170 [Arachidicoccus ginsenosidimutans]|uniref:pirin family protein n=1 Tax=Arachidicoccus sp. BS20 TaxID=1850526 RepID=UPI0007F17FEC|nr:hypothetical protein [Arachidicoccus sp. BS20]ANI87873.1 hypothetical protein A9P82_00170 [Arachidicoccus sp. BS20]